MALVTFTALKVNDESLAEDPSWTQTVFFLYFILVGMTAYMVSKTVVQELKPTVRQTTEETLVDMANLLAVLAEEDVANGKLSESRFSKLLAAYGQREPQARIWEIGKKSD